ncbi:MAG: hypothetical protein R3229_17345 [Alphaproteobacteria bacterium]|nr:hypothetical protein [Alphaproteobacteria bacterium]
MDQRETTLTLSRRELYDRVWRTPVGRLAKEFRLSGRGLGKLCERHGIPVPPRGYWAKKAAGKRPKRTPLMEIGDARRAAPPIDLTLRNPRPKAEGGDDDGAPSAYRELHERLLGEIGDIRVPGRLTRPHEIIGDWPEAEAHDRRDSQGLGARRGYFRGRFAGAATRRRLRILNTVFQALEARGIGIETGFNDSDRLEARLGCDRIAFTLNERRRRVRRARSAKERAQNPDDLRRWVQSYEPSGVLIFELTRGQAPGLSTSWQDEPDAPLEGHVTEILATLLVALAHAREIREQEEAAARRRREAEEEEQRREAERHAERSRKLALRQRVKAWRVAEDIRAYVEAVEKAVESGELEVEAPALASWVTWAEAHAAELDPIAAGSALEKALLWEDEETRDPARSWASATPRTGDPNWFWGRRWWARN